MTTTLAMFLGLFFYSLPSGGEMGSDPRETTIDTPSGTVVATTSTVDPFPQKIVPVSVSQAAEFNALAAQSAAFMGDYVAGQAALSLERLDEAFRLWQLEKGDRYTQQQVVEILGAYLGSRLVSDFDMEWVVVTDQYGTDYAVRAKRSEVMSFPFSSVLKRIENQQYDFMSGVYHTVKHVVESSDYRARDAEDGS